MTFCFSFRRDFYAEATTVEKEGNGVAPPVQADFYLCSRVLYTVKGGREGKKGKLVSGVKYMLNRKLYGIVFRSSS